MRTKRLERLLKLVHALQAGRAVTVEVLEPTELRRMIADHVVSLQLTYRDVLGGNGQSKAVGG